MSKLYTGLTTNGVTELTLQEEGVGNIGTQTIVWDDTVNGEIDQVQGDIPGNWKNGGGIKQLQIGTSCTSIGSNAFYDCTGLTGDLVIPDSVTSIGNFAFYFCSGLTSLTIGNSVTVIGNSAFRLCTNLTGSLVIPDNILTIEREAFWGCGFTGTLTIPANILTIMPYTFRDCTGFTDLIIEDGLDRIHFNAFQDCAFTSVTLPSTITRLDQSCFRGNSNLTDFTFPESLTIIGQGVLVQCTNITNVNIYVTKTLFEANDTTFPQVYGQLANTGVTTVHVRASDNTWTAGAGQTIGGKTGIEVIKDL